MRIVFAALLVAVGLVSQVVAQGFEDDDYIDNYFGTSVIVFSTKPLVDANAGWWTDVLPEDLIYGSSYVTGLVNGSRNTSGEAKMIPADASIVTTGWEEQVDGGYEYNIDFVGVRPSEVEQVFAALGGMEQYLGEAQISFLPLLHQDYYEYTNSFDAPLEITIRSQVYKIDTSQHINDLKSKLNELFLENFGDHTISSISLSFTIYEDSETVSLSFSVDLPAG